jgi:hypothetical protein
MQLPCLFHGQAALSAKDLRRTRARADELHQVDLLQRAGLHHFLDGADWIGGCNQASLPARGLTDPMPQRADRLRGLHHNLMHMIQINDNQRTPEQRSTPHPREEAMSVG